jgi:hypothetical protein
MQIVREELQFREVQYPQISRLPNGVKFVKQNGFPDFLKDKYGARVNKKFFLVRGRNKKDAKKDLLNTLNERLRFVSLCWKNPTRKQFSEAIGK